MAKVDVNSKKAIQEVEELFALKQKFDGVKKKFEERSKILTTSIKNYMYSKGDVNYLSFKLGTGQKIEVKKVSPAKIIWNPDKLEEKLDKELYNELVEKKYIISDFEGLVKYLKSCGVNPKKFKSFLSVEKTVRTDVMKQMDELGELSMEDVKGCYEVKRSESYLKLGLHEEEED